MSDLAVGAFLLASAALLILFLLAAIIWLLLAQRRQQDADAARREEHRAFEDARHDRFCSALESLAAGVSPPPAQRRIDGLFPPMPAKEKNLRADLETIC